MTNLSIARPVCLVVKVCIDRTVGLMAPRTMARMTVVYASGYYMITPTLRRRLLTQRPQAPSGSNNFGVVHDQNNKGNPRGSDRPDGARRTRGLAPIKPNREEPPPWLEYRELLLWERDHGIHKAPSRRDNSGVVNRQNSNGHPRGSDRHDRDRRARGVAPVGSKFKAAKAKRKYWMRAV